MFASTAQAQTPGPAAPASGGPLDAFGPFLLPVVLFALFYFMVLRPQQAKAKAHAATLGGLKRGDTIVLTGGVIGKVSRVDETEVAVDIAPNTTVKVVRSMIADVRTPDVPAPANDRKS